MKPSNVSEFALAIGMLSCFSILGTLARVGCDWIFKSSISILAPNDSPIGTDFMANILGSFIMGALDKLKPREVGLLYIVAASGFCGSFTTFSGWQVQAAQTFLRNHIFVAFLNLLIGVCSFYGSLRSGRHFGSFLQFIVTHYIAPEPQIGDGAGSEQTARGSSPVWQSCRNIVLACLGYAMWLLFGLLFVFAQRSRMWSGPSVFAPLGALLRWYVSRWNANWPNFKLYTFLVNVIGTFIYAVLLVCQLKFATLHGRNILDIVLSALMSGFCGCLTTVSTFVLELRYSPHTYRTYLYCFTSLLAAQSFAICVLSVAKFAYKVPSI